MRGSLGLSLVALALPLVVSSAVSAQAAETTAPPSAEAGAAAPPEPYAPPPAPPAYPAPYPAPYAQPPGYPAPYAQPPGYPAPMPYGLSPWAYYEESRKSAGLAFLFEFLLPGVGSIYADHTTGALITWGLIAGGMVVLLNSGRTTHDAYGYERTEMNGTELAVGVLMLLGGRVYGLVDAISATGDYNARLRQRLGLGARLSLGTAPTPRGGSVLVPSLRFSF